MAECDETAVLNMVKQAVSKTEAAVNTGNGEGALKAAIENPPLLSKQQQTKDMAAENVQRAISIIKETDIPRLAEGLDPLEQDLMMKYVYRGLATGKNCNLLLKWHSVLVDKAGIGCIIRAMSQKKNV